MTVDDGLLAERFEEHRARLLAMACRLLGSVGPAEDAVQEAWVRLSRSDAERIEDLGGWLTTVVARVCLGMLRMPSARREDALDANHLAPAERLVSMLHEWFAMPVEEIAGILGRTPTAVRQLAGRARRRVQSPEWTLEADRTVQGRVVDALLTASGTGDLEELVWLLHPDAVLHADAEAVKVGGLGETRGAQAVAETFARRARTAHAALLDGFAGAVWGTVTRPAGVFGFTVVDGRIAEIEMLADPEVLPLLDLTSGSAAT